MSVNLKEIALPPCTALDRDAIPRLALDEFRSAIIQTGREGGRLLSLFGAGTGEAETDADADAIPVYAVLGFDQTGLVAVVSTTMGDSYPAITPDLPQAHWFERELAEIWGVLPVGHPWLKPIRFQPPRRRGPGNAPNGSTIFAERLPSVTEFYRVGGVETHEVAVGPVHAGVIEPGHFRFQCHGEIVFHLEISLGYQHRGVERALVGGPDKRTMPMMETLAGDTTIGHGSAYCQLMETLGGLEPPPRAQALRAIGLELERLANHTGDMGALAQDVGFLPTSAYCGRLRGDFLNATALICGSRFGRSLTRPGGVLFDLDDKLIQQLDQRMAKALEDVSGAIQLLWDAPTVLARFEETGAVLQAVAEEIGLVGPAARASGVHRDVRQDYPCGYYRFSQIPVSTWHSGDVFARAFVRWLEIQRSVEFIRETLRILPSGELRRKVPPPRPDTLVVSLVEGWRGEICHVALTDTAGKFAAYKVTDPSLHNWFGLALALRDQQISDFPLCNKSFNLSYCGHDL